VNNALGMYPEPVPFKIEQVSVDELHTLHVEHYGNADGVPVVFLHGGPGCSWSPQVLRFFDPAQYRILAFDQRGAWRSTPLGELRNNTLQHLIADIEMLREMINVERWVVFGGSWGSTLAIAYAEEHPQRCSALLLRGVTLFRPGSQQWDFHVTRGLFPEAFEKLSCLAPDCEREDLYGFYRRAILSGDRGVALQASQHWYEYSDLLSNPCNIILESEEDEESDDLVLAGARISMHYWDNHIFLPPDALYENAHRLRGIPGMIVHGLLDFNCTVADALDLHMIWPDAEFKAVENAGHSALEEGIARFTLDIVEGLKSSLK
jgi:proline iminopeptidase